MKAGNHILLVDDDETFTSVMERALRRRAFEVSIAHDAEQALALARSRAPEYVLLDLNLPGPSGLVTLPRLLDTLPRAKIVILTGYSSIATAVEAMKLGATHYLCKPATLADVLGAFEGGETTAAATVPEEPLSVDRLEWEHIQKILTRHGGNITATARTLGMHRRTLQRKLQKRPVKR